MNDFTGVTDIGELRERYGEPSERAVKKELRRLDRHCRAFIALSPFLVIGTSGPDGRGDVSPRGDAPGFVQVIDDHTLAIPDRLGNNRIDTIGNITHNPNVGLIFMVPGMNETLRVNGRAEVVTDEALLAGMMAQNKMPRSAIVVAVEEAYLQCAKALVRSRLWSDDYRIERKSFPSLGQILADQIGADPEETERGIQESMRTRLY